MKLLVADKLEEEALHALRALPGIEVAYHPALAKDQLPAALGDVGVLVVRSRQVTAEAIARAPSLNLIVRAGAGTNTIDVAAASARGVLVANCPGKNAVAVAELVVGMVLAQDRRLPDAVASLRAGRWEKAEYGRADGVFGRSLGVAGYGAIGAEVVTRAVALGMTPHAWSRSLTDAQARALGLTRHETLLDLARASDVLSLHLPLAPETRGIVGEEVLSALPPRAILVNTSRAEVLDYDALTRAVKSRGLRVALDVFPGEPEGPRGEFRHELLGLPGVYATPHVGASTAQAQLAIAAETVRVVRTFLETGAAPNCVNVAVSPPPARCQVITRHLDRVGVLASVLGVIKKHGINVGEMTNTQFEGGAAATARIGLGALPEASCLEELRALPDVLRVEVVRSRGE